MAYPLVGSVVGIDEPLRPALRHASAIDSVSMVLARHPAARSSDLDTGLILTPVTEVQLVGIETRGQRQ